MRTSIWKKLECRADLKGVGAVAELLGLRGGFISSYIRTALRTLSILEACQVDSQVDQEALRCTVHMLAYLYEGFLPSFSSYILHILCFLFFYFFFF